MKKLTKTYGHWALVTGASSGIGRAFAEQLAEAGCNLILAARNESSLRILSEELTHQHGIESKIASVDLSTEEGNLQLIELTHLYDIGLFVAAAGYGTSGEFADSSLEQEANMVQLNCLSVTQLAHHFAAKFKQKKRGGIILLSSIVAFQGVPRSANYAATKAYIQTLAEGLRPELRPHGVDVIASAPGPVSSGFAERANMQMSQTETPETVARETLHNLGAQTTIRPGIFSKILGYSLAMTPRWGRVKIMTQVMSGMTRHQRAVAAPQL